MVGKRIRHFLNLLSMRFISNVTQQNTGNVHFSVQRNKVANKEEEKKCLSIVFFSTCLVCVWMCTCVFQMLKHKIFVKEEDS